LPAVPVGEKKKAGVSATGVERKRKEVDKGANGREGERVCGWGRLLEYTV
jgi:hypothetical protein